MYSAGNKSQLLLTICILLASVSLFNQLQGWILVLLCCAVVMRIALYLQYQKHLPSVRTLNLLALLSALVLAYFSWQLGLLLAMVNLLVLACALKLMQLRANRDYFQLVSAEFFVLGCGLIFEQSIVYTLFYFTLALLLLVSMAFHISPSVPINRQLKRVGIMSLQALPIAILMFMVLPQLDPLWQMPASKNSKTGLSDKVSPGDIAELSQSSELAFRASFSGDIPLPPQRYWRAIVLEYFDGKSWQPHPRRSQANLQLRQMRQEFSPGTEGPYFQYQVIAEASQQHWLFGLDVAIPADPDSNNKIWQSHDYQLLSQHPLFSQFQYQLRSYYQQPLNQGFLAFDKALNLQVPEQGNPRTRAWVDKLRKQYPQDGEFITALKQYFAQGFRYTLRPEVMQNEPVDQLLFDKKAGFCAHFASAMAYALRLGGIPARMVTGYLGGELNQSNTMSIYQYDAHAWVEVWHQQFGWQRLDPTALVAPDRVNYGLERAMQEEGSFLADNPFSLASLKSIAILNELRLALADLYFLWSHWVLGFNHQAQQDLFKSLLGKLTPERLGALGLAVLALISLLLAIFFVPAWGLKKRHPSYYYYQQALAQLAKLAIERPHWQGTTEFAEVVKKSQNKQLGHYFAKLSHSYNRLNYSQLSHADKIEQLNSMRRDVHKLKLAIKKQIIKQPHQLKS
jgi:protein-glutamine gamma-glutamyltransferase